VIKVRPFNRAVAYMVKGVRGHLVNIAFIWLLLVK